MVSAEAGEKQKKLLLNLAKKKKNKEIIRTYHLGCHANDVKMEQVEAVLRAYQRAAVSIASMHWRLFFEKKQQFFDFRDLSSIQTSLSARYLQTCQSQVVGQLQSFITNTQTRFVKAIYSVGESLTDEQRHHLFFINRCQRWQENEVTLKDGTPIPKETILIARKLFKHLTRNKPRLGRVNMTLDEKVAVVTPMSAEEGEATGFDWWVKFSTLTPRRPTQLPLRSTEHFKDVPGILKKAIQVNRAADGKLQVCLIKVIAPQIITFASKRLGLDVGTVNFIATEHGDLLGRKLMGFLKKYDNITTKLMSNLNRQGVKLSTNKRYCKLIRKVRGFMKSEIGRIVNKLFTRLKPEEIVVENLDFRGSNIGRKNNRLLHKFGKGILKHKLECMSQTHGFKLTPVNPAYTSQECPSCHFTSKDNRKTRDKFQCGCCGLNGHADVVGGRNVSGRSSAEFVKLNKREIFELLSKKHSEKEMGCRCRKTKDQVPDAASRSANGSQVQPVKRQKRGVPETTRCRI